MLVQAASVLLVVRECRPAIKPHSSQLGARAPRSSKEMPHFCVTLVMMMTDEDDDDAANDDDMIRLQASTPRSQDDGSLSQVPPECLYCTIQVIRLLPPSSLFHLLCPLLVQKVV